MPFVAGVIVGLIIGGNVVFLVGLWVMDVRQRKQRKLREQRLSRRTGAAHVPVE